VEDKEKAIITDSENIIAETKNAITETESVITETESVISETESVISEAEIGEVQTAEAEGAEPLKEIPLKEKLKAMAEKYKNTWQLIKFTLVSMTAGVTELVLALVLNIILRGMNGEPFEWFIFKFNGTGQGAGTFISFLVSICVAQVIAFTINFKKTFKPETNLSFAIPAYVVMVIVFIIGLQMFFLPYLTDALNRLFGIEDLAVFSAKLIGALYAFVVTFVCSKYIIMREKKE